MARGWESKEVESQIEAAETRATESARPPLSPEQLARERELDLLNLSRTRVQHDIESSVNYRYREILRQSLAFLDEKIAALRKP